MNVRDEIEAELPAGSVQFTLDPDTAVAIGRSERRRRRLVGGGAGLAVVAGAVALVTMLPIGVNGATPTRDPQGPAAGPVGPTPADVQPAWEAWSVWAGPGADPPETSRTQSYTDAFWAYFSAKYPGVRLVGIGPDGPGPDPTGPPAEFGRFRRGFVTYGDTEGEAITLFRYRLEPVQDGETGSQLTIVFPGRDGTEDLVGVEVYPPESHHVDTGDALDLTTWYPTGFPPSGAFDPQVERATGPNGEDLRYVTMEPGRIKGSGWLWAGSYVVLYRPDGSAVVVSDRIRVGLTEDGPVAPEDRPVPYLSFEDLAAIALALPMLPVE